MKTAILILTCLLMFSNCREDSKAKSIGFGTNLSQRVDQDAFSQMSPGFSNDSIISDQFFLKGAEIIGSQLYIDVSYGGGCQEHAFELIWPEAITMIYPPQFSLILTHDGNNDTCEAAISEMLIFELAGNGLGLGEDVFHVMKLTIINASNPEENIQVNE